MKRWIRYGLLLAATALTASTLAQAPPSAGASSEQAVLEPGLIRQFDQQKKDIEELARKIQTMFPLLRLEVLEDWQRKVDSMKREFATTMDDVESNIRTLEADKLPTDVLEQLRRERDEMRLAFRRTLEGATIDWDKLIEKPLQIDGATLKCVRAGSAVSCGL
ncbi:MAG TPA: hypothetical protein VFY29_06215 [Terriglobia bacterium]|nr:hypothetical protein [Terriglobia bacterium]